MDRLHKTSLSDTRPILKLERGFGRIKHFERTDSVQNPVSLPNKAKDVPSVDNRSVLYYFFNRKSLGNESTKAVRYASHSCDTPQLIIVQKDVELLC